VLEVLGHVTYGLGPAKDISIKLMIPLSDPRQIGNQGPGGRGSWMVQHRDNPSDKRGVSRIGEVQVETIPNSTFCNGGHSMVRSHKHEYYSGFMGRRYITNGDREV